MAAKSKAKQQSVKVEDKEGHAVVSVDVPARTVEVSVAHSDIPGCAIAAVEAWDKVRDVEGGDVVFANALPEFRQHLINAAEGVYRSGTVLQGDTSLARFEQEVAAIRGRQDREKAKTAKAA